MHQHANALGAATKNSGFKRVMMAVAGIAGIAIAVGVAWYGYASRVSERQIASSLPQPSSRLDTSASGPAPQESDPMAVASKKQQTIVQLPVLMYHYIRTVTDPRDKLGYNLSVTPKDFEQQMRYLAENKFTTVTPDDLVKAWQGQGSLPQKSVLLTFDDGYQDFYDQAFPVLKKYNLKATLFVVTGFVGDKQHRYVTWDEIAEMDRSGLVTMASHTLTHASLPKSKNAKGEIADSKKIMEDFVGHPVGTFAYPYGAFNDSTAALVQKAGYDMAFTTQGGATMSYQKRFVLPRVRISGGLSLVSYKTKVQPAGVKTGVKSGK